MPKKAVRIEVLLPTHYKNHKTIEPEKRSQTIAEIYKKFGAYTIMGIMEGGWRNTRTGKIERDKIRGFYVDIDKKKFSENTEWFRQYKNTLIKRFEQDEIYIVYWNVYVI